MRILSVLLSVLFLSGCARYEVDINGLSTNPFDQDHVGTPLIRLDSVRTIPVIQGAVYQQRLYVHVSDLLLAEGGYELRMIDLTDVDTVYATQAGSSTVVLLNQQVTLGTTYCLLVDLSIGGAYLTTQRLDTCALAQL
jgi:hypothetical protein